MAKKVATPNTSTPTTDTIEQGVVAFAEQLGTLVGTVQSKADGWTDREALGRELTRIRDGAAQLLDQLNPRTLMRAKTTAKGKKAAPAARSRGLVDAPGKRHRRPPPQERVGKHASDPKARIIGNPGLKTGRRGNRG
jgi:hypothetical protein